MKFIIYLDRKKEFRWKLLGKNKKIIAVAGEGFTQKHNCKRSIKTLSTIAGIAVAIASIEDRTLKTKKK